VIAALQAIEVPAEHAWTETLAQVWWLENKPSEKQTKPTGPGIARTIVAQRDATADEVATASGKLRR
ncbi:MAG TPA: hypothetical protein VFQ65_03775, partial [Kofleriaceae bacterium]|nr:hypothetical protein [Kofleriaceae bacterium]